MKTFTERIKELEWSLNYNKTKVIELTEELELLRELEAFKNAKNEK